MPFIRLHIAGDSVLQRVEDIETVLPDDDGCGNATIVPSRGDEYDVDESLPEVATLLYEAGEQIFGYVT